MTESNTRTVDGIQTPIVSPTQEGHSLIEIKHGVQRDKQRGRAKPTVGQIQWNEN